MARWAQGEPYATSAIPYIGENGNWWVNQEDTGVKAQGPEGKTGARGPAGIGAPGPALQYEDLTEAQKQELGTHYSAEISVIRDGAVAASETAVHSANMAATHSADSEMYAKQARSYTVGDTVLRPNESTDNAAYYYNQTKRIAQSLNGLAPMGTITFAELPTENIVANAMYNISDAFTSDERFIDGGGKQYGVGSNVYYTTEGFWDVLASNNVTGVKGEAEAEYQQGNVNITTKSLGLDEQLKDTVPYNLIPYPYYDSAFEENGITWSVDNDGVVVANGNATSSESFIIRHRISNDSNKLILPAGTYTFNGCPIGGSSKTYYANVARTNPTNGSFLNLAVDYGNGVTFTLEDETQIYVGAYIVSGQTVENLTFKPMLVKGDTAKEFKKQFDNVYKLNERLDGLTFAQDEEGNWGYIPSGADTVIPFKTSGGHFSPSLVLETISKASLGSTAITLSKTFEAEANTNYMIVMDIDDSYGGYDYAYYTYGTPGIVQDIGAVTCLTPDALTSGKYAATATNGGPNNNQMTACRHCTFVYSLITRESGTVTMQYANVKGTAYTPECSVIYKVFKLSEVLSSSDGNILSNSATLKTAELTVTARGTSIELDFSKVTDEYAKIKAENITLKSAYIVGYAPTTANSTIDLSITSYDNTTGVAVANLMASFPGTGVTKFEVTVVATWLDTEDEASGGSGNVEIALISSGYNWGAGNDSGTLFEMDTTKFSKLTIGSFVLSQANNMGIKITGSDGSTETQLFITKSSISTITELDISSYTNLKIILVAGTSSSETCSLRDIVFSR